jgi:peptidoglycan/LPS O-acetylase OafA/YrhL
VRLPWLPAYFFHESRRGGKVVDGLWTLAVHSFCSDKFTGFIDRLVNCRSRCKRTNFLKVAGNLSYGMYLNHFLVAWAMLTTAQILDWNLFGLPGSFAFGLISILLSMGFAFLTFRLVELPVERVRSWVKKGLKR